MQIQLENNNNIKNTFDFKSINFMGNVLHCPCINGEAFIVLDTVIENIGLSKKLKELTPENRLHKYLIFLKLSIYGTVRCVNLYKNEENIPFSTFSCTQSVEFFNTKRKYILIPVRKFSSWLYEINTNRVSEKAKPILEAYKDKCDDVLYDYFMGDSSKRHQLINNLNEANTKLLKLENELLNSNELFNNYLSLKNSIKNIHKAIRDLDQKILTNSKNTMVQTEIEFNNYKAIG